MEGFRGEFLQLFGTNFKNYFVNGRLRTRHQIQAFQKFS